MQLPQLFLQALYCLLLSWCVSFLQLLRFLSGSIWFKKPLSFLFLSVLSNTFQLFFLLLCWFKFLLQSLSFYSSHCMFLFCSLLHQKHLYLFEAWSKEESNSSLICKSATSIFFADSELWVSLSALKLIPWRLGARTSLLRENPQMKKTGWMRNSSLKGTLLLSNRAKLW